VKRCLICDDHAMVREALGGLITRRWPDAEICEAADFPSAWALAARGADFCLVDLDMPGAEPLMGITELQAAAADLPLLVVTGSHDDQLLLELIAQGVAGFAPKQSTTAVLSAAIDLILAGGRYLPPRMADLKALPARSVDPPARRGALLSPRQLEVLRLLAQGKSNKEIAQTLEVSPATIKTHVAQIIALTSATNRIEAAMRARQLGFL
jgi:DNA-binding NarL/FixJ family response regulator